MFKTLTLALVAASIASSSMAFTANSLPGDIISGAEEVVFMKKPVTATLWNQTLSQLLTPLTKLKKVTSNLITLV